MTLLDTTKAVTNHAQSASPIITELTGSYFLPKLPSRHGNRISDVDREPSAHTRAMCWTKIGRFPQTDPLQSIKYGAKLYPLYEAEIVGDRKCGLTINNNQIITDSARDHLATSLLIRRFNESTASHTNPLILEGQYVSLVGNGADNFWHWVVEYLPKIELAENAGFKGIYLVPAGKAFVAESLKLLNIASDRIKPFTGGTWKPEVLYVPEHLPVWTDEMRHGDSYAHLQLLKDIREKLLVAAHQRKTGQEFPKKIWIQRKNTTRPDTITNNSDVEETVKTMGFSVVALEDYSLAEQILLASQAQCFAGLHGASMTHLLFLPEGAKALEIYSYHYDVDFYKPVLSANPNQIYHERFITDVFEYVSKNNTPAHFQDVYIDLELLESALAKLSSNIIEETFHERQ